MADYRYLAQDVRTGALLGELPLSGVSYGRHLNMAGTLNATITLGQRTTGGQQLDTALLSTIQPVRTAVYVERDGVLVWGGILWDHGDYDSKTRQLGISCSEFWSYFMKRRLRRELDYSGIPTDQFQVARDLIYHTQFVVGGNIGVVTDPVPMSGVLINPIYRSWERRNVGQVIYDLSASDQGFDFAIDIGGSPGATTLTLNLAKHRGRLAEATGLVFEVGKNVGSYKWPIAGSASATAIDAIGQGEGASMLIATQVRSDLIDAGYPMVDDVISFKSISDPNMLDWKARSAAAARGLPMVTATLVNVMPSGDPPLGSWIMGDAARFRVEDDERFPASPSGAPGLDVYGRIIGDQVQVSDNGLETVNISMEFSNNG